MGVLLPHVILLGIEMPRVGPPPVRGTLRAAQGLQLRLPPQAACLLPRSNHLSPLLPRGGHNGLPHPAWGRLAAHVTPHVVQCCGEPAPSLQFLRAAPLRFHVLRMQDLQYCLVHWLERRGLFFNSVMTVFVLTCRTRAVSRIPLALRAISTICCLTSGLSFAISVMISARPVVCMLSCFQVYPSRQSIGKSRPLFTRAQPCGATQRPASIEGPLLLVTGTRLSQETVSVHM